ncbi:MAG: putative NRPS-like protein biosynthetic cluster [Candelaria pacifica]|nr:MAG: putative NRPS-like protein biosynthetic cluster [Candelaria pacifica]
MSSNAEQQAEMAELHGPIPQSPLPSLWKTFASLVPIRGEIAAVVSRHQVGDQKSGPLVCSYVEMYHKAQTLAARLFNVGVRKGTTIAAIVDNRVEWALIFWASIKLDAIFVPINPRSINSPREFEHMVGVSQPGVVVVIDEEAADKLNDLATDEMAKTRIRLLLTVKSVSSIPHGWTWIGQLLDPETEISGPPDPLNNGDQPAIIIFTSGTTSLPKACLLSHSNICASVIAHQDSRHVTEESILVQHLPSFHAWGVIVTLAFWMKGASVVYPSASFDAGSTLIAIQEDGCTHMAAVPSMISALTNHPLMSSSSLGSLRSVDLAGSIVHPETVRACMDRSRIGALYASASYGMTEGSAVLALDGHKAPYDENSVPTSTSVGSPTARAKVRVCEPGTRTVLKRGSIGELHIGGAQVTKGYLGTTSDAIYEDDIDNWIATGDRVTIDENGVVSILGRYKDLIIRGGENISPVVIERYLDQYDGTVSQVVGVPDEIAGEIPVAVIQRNKDVNVPGSVKQQLIVQELGQNSKPERVLDLRDDLGQSDFPKTLSGKVQKSVLKDMVERFLSEETNGTYLDNGIQSTIDALIAIWAQATGKSTRELSTTLSVDSFADSITMMRYIQLVKKKLGKALSIDDLRANDSIEAQANLLDSRSSVESSSCFRSQDREGPPEVADMIHAQGNRQVFKLTQDKVERTLAPIGLLWNNVEDVLPMDDFPALQLRDMRKASWNHRQAYFTSSASPPELRHAVESCLKVHPILRSMVVYYDDTTPLYIVMRPNKAWFDFAITEGHEVGKPEELARYLYNDVNADHAGFPGPLFKIMIVKILNTNTAGIIYVANHSCFDALSINLWLEDLDAALGSNSSPLSHHVDFRLFAKDLYQSRNTSEMHKASAFHYNRLRGISNFKEALWPPQRAPQWFKGSPIGWNSQCERVALDGADAIGVSGISVSISLPSLPTIKSKHGIPAQIVVKAALALLNVRLTQQKQAIFSQYEAARYWPSRSNDAENTQANDPMDIAGPTFQLVLNLIPISGSEKLSQFLHRLHKEQELLTHNAIAPLRQIQALLASSGEESSLSNENENSLFDTIMRRQVFNWIPNTHPLYQHISKIQVESRSDLGVTWVCNLVDKQTLFLNAQYDDAQLYAVEVRKAVDELIDIIDWITEKADWDQEVRTCLI